MIVRIVVLQLDVRAGLDAQPLFHGVSPFLRLLACWVRRRQRGKPASQASPRLLQWNTMRWWLCLFVLCLLAPVHVSDFVDPSLSHVRLVTLLSGGDETTERLQGQMVLWQGWLVGQSPPPDGSTDVVLRTGDGATIPIHYRKGCRNLQVDRRGARWPRKQPCNWRTAS